jgi:hypothetical protein
MVNHQVMQRCPLCGRDYQHVPNPYEGRQLALYGDLFCCDKCWESNPDGWNSRHEPTLLRHLQQKGLRAPERNENGSLPRN